MSTVLVLRFDAPLMAFGGPMIDQIGGTRRFPGASLLTGLFGNALGWRHGDGERLNALQDRLRIACLDLPRRRRPLASLTDFQTVDLGQGFLNGTGWTTRGRREDKGGGTATRETHIRYRDYRVEAAVLAFVALRPEEAAPTPAALAAALRAPARPLYIGRRSCVPSGPLLLGTLTADGLWQAACALAAGTAGLPDDALPDGGRDLVGEWPADEPGWPADGRPETVIDTRDWRNQLHGGERAVRTGVVRFPAVAAGNAA